MTKQKKPDTWMPWYIADYLADTTHLSTEQHGAYMLLLMAAWRRGGELPDDDEQLAAISRLPSTSWRKHKPVLLAFFTRQDGVLVQARLSEELASALKAYGTKIENGKKGGRPKNQKPNDTENKPAGFDSLNPPAKRTETQPQPQEHLSEPDGSESVRAHELPDIWRPDLDRLKAELMRSGIPCPDDESLQQTLSRFTLEYHDQFEKFPDRWPENKRYGRLLGWLTEDHRNGKQNHVRDNRDASSGQHARETPVERAVRENREQLRREGIDPDAVGVRG